MSVILQYAAGVTTILSLLSFLGGSYVWLQSQRRERSVVDTIKGEGVVQAQTVVKILKQFKGDEARLAALQEVLGYSKDRAADVLDKVKPNVDVGKFSLLDQVHLQQRLLVAGVVLIVLAALSIVASRSRAETPDKPAPTNPLSATAPKLKPEVKSDEGQSSYPKPLGSASEPKKDQGISSQLENKGETKPSGRTDDAEDDPHADLRQLLETSWKSPWKAITHDNKVVRLEYELLRVDACVFSWKQREDDKPFPDTDPTLDRMNSYEIKTALGSVQTAYATTDGEYKGWVVRLDGYQKNSFSVVWTSNRFRNGELWVSNTSPPFSAGDEQLNFPYGSESAAKEAALLLKRLASSCQSPK